MYRIAASKFAPFTITWAPVCWARLKRSSPDQDKRRCSGHPASHLRDPRLHGSTRRDEDRRLGVRVQSFIGDDQIGLPSAKPGQGFAEFATTLRAVSEALQFLLQSARFFLFL